MRVLIAGCGYVGTALGLQLAEAGHEVLGLRRDPSSLPAPITPIAAHLTRDNGLAKVPTDVDAVAYCVSSGGRDRDAYLAAYVEGQERLADHLGATARTDLRWVFTSSTAVYGQTDGSDVDEDSPTEPTSDTAQVLLRAEAVARSVGGTVLRLAGIYGPGRTRLIDQVRDGEATCPPPPSWTNRIHREDCAGALAHILALADPDPVYVGVDDDPAERCEVLRWLAERLGAPEPEPGPPSRRGGNKRARNDRLRGSGYELRYPSFRDGYAEMLEGA